MNASATVRMCYHYNNSKSNNDCRDSNIFSESFYK